METRKKIHCDRISALPESLQLHVLSFLTYDCAVRTSVLSKSWRTVWTGLTCIQLEGINYCGGEFFKDNATTAREKGFYTRKSLVFHDFLDRVFGSISNLQELKLCVPGFGLELKPRLNHWIDCAIGFNVKKLDLVMDKCHCYGLPKSILSSTSLTSLRLEHCFIVLDSLTDTPLPKFRTLHLENVGVTAAVMESLLANCLNLESFTFNCCYGLTSLKVSGLTKLKTFNVALLDTGLMDIEIIKASDLLEFRCEYSGKFEMAKSCKMKLSSCTNVKRLELRGIQFEAADLNVFLRKFPVLERLSIKGLFSSEYVMFLKQRLLSRKYDCFWKLKKVKHDTLNLEILRHKREDWTLSVLKHPIELLRNLIAELLHCKSSNFELVEIIKPLLPEDV